MHGREQNASQTTGTHARRRRPATLLAAGALAVLGLSLTASAAFGGFSGLAGLVRDHVYCEVVRDCVYDSPETHIVSGPGGVTHDPTPTFRFSSDEGQVKYRCRIDHGNYRTCQNPYTTFRLKDGHHRIQVFAVDGDGNADPTPAEREFRVEADGPGNSHHGGHGHGHHGHGHGHGHGNAGNGHGHGHGGDHGHGHGDHGHGHGNNGHGDNGHGHGHGHGGGHGHGDHGHGHGHHGHGGGHGHHGHGHGHHH